MFPPQEFSAQSYAERHGACCQVAGGCDETGGPGGNRAAAAGGAAGVHHVRAGAGSRAAQRLPQLRAARLSDGLVSCLICARVRRRSTRRCSASTRFTTLSGTQKRLLTKKRRATATISVTHRLSASKTRSVTSPATPSLAHRA